MEYFTVPFILAAVSIALFAAGRFARNRAHSEERWDQKRAAYAAIKAALHEIRTNLQAEGNDHSPRQLMKDVEARRSAIEVYTDASRPFVSKRAAAALVPVIAWPIETLGNPALKQEYAGQVEISLAGIKRIEKQDFKSLYDAERLRRRYQVLSIFFLGIAVVTLVPEFHLFPPYRALGECRVPGAQVPEMKLTRRTSVGLAVSGGGSRAAYFSAAILREIHRSKIKALFPREETNNDLDLLDQLDAISSVSGGSFAATYFVANSDKLKRAEANSASWDDYLDKMALNYRPREWYAFNPVAWLKSLLTDYNRSYLAREDYDTALFNGATLADLPDRPAIFINAFDLANEIRFVFSKHDVDTSRYLTRYLSRLQIEASKVPKDLAFDVDLAAAALMRRSIRLADAIAASSAYPLAYPNVAVRNCNPGELFRGNLLFLTDGGLADNSGLVTLLTRMHAAGESAPRGANVLIIYIDASTDQVASYGSSFQQSGIEESYAWRNTVFGHFRKSIEGAIDMLAELNLKYVDSIGVETFQLRSDWEKLGDRTGRCVLSGDASWSSAFERGQIALRPLVIRLGLRDLVDPLTNFEYDSFVARSARLSELLDKNDLRGGVADIAKEPFAAKLRGIATDFELSQSSRNALDLAAYLLVNAKLRFDLAEWDGIAAAHTTLPTSVRCDRLDPLR